MNVVEKIAYTKGFFSGLDIDDNTKEGKAFHALLGLLEELVVSNTDLEQQCAKLKSQVSEIDEHVSEVFNSVFDNASYDRGNDAAQHNDLFEVICPECDTRTTFGQSVAVQGHMKCPGCGINLEFDYEDAQTERVELQMPQQTFVQEMDEQLPAPPEPESALRESVTGMEEEQLPYSELDMANMAFSTAPPVPNSEGEKDQIPQTEDFVYSESTEDFEISDAVEQPESSDVAAQTEPEVFASEAPQAEQQDAEAVQDGESPELRSALVKVDFVADPEAFEAGKKKGAEYRFSEENVTIDFSKMIPDAPEMSASPEA